VPMRSCELLLPAGPTALAEARAVVEAIGSDLPEPVLVDAKLLLTELVANAIKHASRGMQAVIIRIRMNHFVRVEVLDPGPMFHRTRDHLAPGPGAVAGYILWTRLPPPGASSPTRPVRRSGSSCGWRRVEGGDVGL
jgi:anti-sigma regulatory factor (Ser/Thr protein kinase)